MKPRVVFFDIGNTLINSDSILRHAVRAGARALASHGWIKDAEVFGKAYLEADREIDDVDINHLFSDLRILRHLWSKLGWEEDLRALGLYLTIHRQAVREQLRSDTKLVKLLQKLKADGILLGILSNGTIAEQMETLFRLGVISLFEPNLIFLSEDHGISKSNRELFIRAISQAEVQPSRIMMVGDRLDTDMRFAAELGMITVLVDLPGRPSSGYEVLDEMPHFIIGGVLELPIVLNRLGSTD
jgi:HAD superfamily hydrolase (TIGR01549 family)